MIDIIFPLPTLRRRNRIEWGERGEIKPRSATLKIVASMGRERAKKKMWTSSRRGTAMGVIVPILTTWLGGGSVRLHFSCI